MTPDANNLEMSPSLVLLRDPVIGPSLALILNNAVLVYQRWAYAGFP